MTTTKNGSQPQPGDARKRLHKGLAQVLDALAELLVNWIWDR